MTDAYNNLINLIDKRHSCRSFLDKEITDSLIEKIIAVAQKAPYASNKKNWKIIVIKDKKQIQQIAHSVMKFVNNSAEEISDDFKKGFLDYAKHFDFFKTAPALLIPVYKTARAVSLMMQDDAPKIVQWEDETYAKSISAVVTYILLANESLGLGACYMTGPLIAETEIKKILDLRSDRRIGAIIPIGYKTEYIQDTENE